MNEELIKEIKIEILKQINLPNFHQNELKDIMIDFDKVLEKVSKLPKELKKESFRIFVSLLIKYKLITL